MSVSVRQICIFGSKEWDQGENLRDWDKSGKHWDKKWMCLRDSQPCLRDSQTCLSLVLGFSCLFWQLKHLKCWNIHKQFLLCVYMSRYTTYYSKRSQQNLCLFSSTSCKSSKLGYSCLYPITLCYCYGNRITRLSVIELIPCYNFNRNVTIRNITITSFIGV